MLVVMEDGNAHLRLQPVLDLEALRRLDVFQIDATKGGLERRDRADHALHIRRIDLDVEHVDARELLEQDGLALHHRFRGKGPDIAEAKHRRAIGDHGNQIGTRRIVGCKCRVIADSKAGRSHAGRVGQRQVALISEWLGRLDL